jgi:hypothetical protein
MTMQDDGLKWWEPRPIPQTYIGDRPTAGDLAKAALRPTLTNIGNAARRAAYEGTGLIPGVASATRWGDDPWYHPSWHRAALLGLDAADLLGGGVIGKVPRGISRIPGIGRFVQKAANPLVDFWRKNIFPPSMQDLPIADARDLTQAIRYGPPKPKFPKPLYPPFMTQDEIIALNRSKTPDWQLNPESLPYGEKTITGMPGSPSRRARSPFMESDNWGLGGEPGFTPSEGGISSYTAIPRPKMVKFTQKNPRRGSGRDIAEGFIDPEGNPLTREQMRQVTHVMRNPMSLPQEGGKYLDVPSTRKRVVKQDINKPTDTSSSTTHAVGRYEQSPGYQEAYAQGPSFQRSDFPSGEFDWKTDPYLLEGKPVPTLGTDWENLMNPTEIKTITRLKPDQVALTTPEMSRELFKDFTATGQRLRKPIQVPPGMTRASAPLDISSILTGKQDYMRDVLPVTTSGRATVQEDPPVQVQYAKAWDDIIKDLPNKLESPKSSRSRDWYERSYAHEAGKPPTIALDARKAYPHLETRELMQQLPTIPHISYGISEEGATSPNPATLFDIKPTPHPKNKYAVHISPDASPERRRLKYKTKKPKRKTASGFGGNAFQDFSGLLG